MELTIGFTHHHPDILTRANAASQLPRSLQRQRHADRSGARTSVESLQIGYYQRNTFPGMWVQLRPGSLPVLYQIGHITCPSRQTF
jgi:hypothetical protein